MPYKIDLHTHSIASPDGALSLSDYEHVLESGILDCVAITDHNTIVLAKHWQTKLGKERVIVGEEITTTSGEIIGLYLKEQVPAGLSPIETVRHIKGQGGLVLVPHPFETVRTGISEKALNEIIADVDIIEITNGRAMLQNRAELAKGWAICYQKAAAANSDAHGKIGWGRTFSEVSELPTSDTLIKLLRQATYQVGTVGVRGVLYPKLNRVRKQFGFLLGGFNV